MYGFKYVYLVAHIFEYILMNLENSQSSDSVSYSGFFFLHCFRIIDKAFWLGSDFLFWCHRVSAVVAYKQVPYEKCIDLLYNV